MRILVAHSFYRIPGGEDQYVRRLVRLLGSRHDVELLAASNRDLEGNVRIASRMMFSPEKRSEVDRKIKDFRPDVIHLHNPYPAFGPAVHLSARRNRIPLIQTAHNLRLRCPNGLMFTEGESCRRCERGAYFNAVLHHCFPDRKQAAAYATSLWAHRFLLKLESDVRTYIAPSEFLHRRLIEWGVNERDARVVRNFVDVDPEASPEPGTYGLYVGRVSAEKGLEVLVRALALAGDPPFWIVGDGPARAPIEDLGRELGLSRLRLLGWVSPEKVRGLMRGCRVHVLPSLGDENAPLAALEALASARPLIVSDRGGLPELVADGGGVVVPPGDVAALASALKRFYEDDDGCRRMGDEAKRFADRHLTPTAHLGSLEAIYAEAAP